MPERLTPEIIADWRRFRAVVGVYAEHTLDHYPKASLREDWDVQCFTDPAAFAERFPTSDRRQQAILWATGIRATIERTLEVCKPLLDLSLNNKPPDSSLPGEEA